MTEIDNISKAVITLVRLGAVFRFIYCMVRLQSAEDEAGQFKKRMKNAAIFYVIAESVWQLKAIIFYYY